MANITQLAKTFNITRQGIYKINKQNNFNLSNIDNVKAKEILKRYIDNKNKNINYIANGLSVSITKAKRLIDKYNIVYANYETAEEIIKEIQLNEKRKKDQKQKEETIKHNLKVYIQMYKYFTSMLNYNRAQYMRIIKRIEKPKHIYSRERDKKTLNIIDNEYRLLIEQRENIIDHINETSKGNTEVLNKQLKELALLKGILIEE